jgi:hypothetical protein
MDLPNPITPGEAFILLDPKRSSPIEAAKITLLSLIAQRALRIEKAVRSNKSETRILVWLRVRRMPPATTDHVSELMAIVRDSEELDGTVADIMRRAKAKFGPKLARYKSDLILPALKARALIEECTKTILFSFPVMAFRYTLAGAAERSAIERRIAEARRLPALLRSNTKEAAALALAADPAIFLLPELRPYYKQISQALQARDLDEDPSISGFEWEIEFDWDTLAALGGAAMDAFDAAFVGGGGGNADVDAGSGGGEGGMDMG